MTIRRRHCPTRLQLHFDSRAGARCRHYDPEHAPFARACCNPVPVRECGTSGPRRLTAIRSGMRIQLARPPSAPCVAEMSDLARRIGRRSRIPLHPVVTGSDLTGLIGRQWPPPLSGRSATSNRAGCGSTRRCSVAQACLARPRCRGDDDERVCWPSRLRGPRQKKAIARADLYDAAGTQLRCPDPLPARSGREVGRQGGRQRSPRSVPTVTSGALASGRRAAVPRQIPARSTSVANDVPVLAMVQRGDGCQRLS